MFPNGQGPMGTGSNFSSLYNINVKVKTVKFVNVKS